MEESLSLLVVTALTLGVVHTAIGPDHYLPFIVLGRAEGWTLRRTALSTLVCGIGHVGSSVLVGGLGIALGWGLGAMEGFEAYRGDIASYTLIGFGSLYMIWGVVRAGRHSHAHAHADGTVHSHPHEHAEDAEHASHPEEPHDEPAHVRAHRRTFWALFLIFVLGPCEPLIPLLLVPASAHSAGGIALVAGVFAVATIGTMLVLVSLGHLGLGFLRFGWLERYAHAMSGGAILASGAAIKLLGI